MPNTIWVDADACPVAIREILIKASMRTKIDVIFVANSPIRLPAINTIRFVQTDKQFDSADNYISEHSQANDLAITQDIPLASELIDKGVSIINTRGQALTKENIKSRLNMRDFLETMRSSGIQTGGPSQFTAKEKQDFANLLDRWITKALKNKR